MVRPSEGEVAVEKFSVSLPYELVVEIDALAHKDGATRSAIVREATSEYVANRSRAGRDAVRRAQIDEAIALLGEVSTSWGPDDRSALDYLDEVRGQGPYRDWDIGEGSETPASGGPKEGTDE